MARRFFVVPVVLALVSLFLALTPGASQASIAQCAVSANNPHWSEGAGGVIAKSTMTCSARHGQGLIAISLYRCNIPPVKNVIWLDNTCAQWLLPGGLLPTRNISPVVAGTKYTYYSPPQGFNGMGGHGYFINYSIFGVGDGTSKTDFSGVYSR